MGTGETWTRAPASLHAIKINEITADSSCRVNCLFVVAQRQHEMAKGWLTFDHKTTLEDYFSTAKASSRHVAEAEALLYKLSNIVMEE